MTVSTACVCQAIVHRSLEVVRDLRNLARSNQSAHRHQAPISRRKVRTQLQVVEHNVSGVLLVALSDTALLSQQDPAGEYLDQH